MIDLKTGRMRKTVSVLVFILSLFIFGCKTVDRGQLSTAAKAERLVEILNRAKREFNIPALGVIILSSGGVIDRTVIGLREVGGGSPAAADDYFHLGSNTKAITGFIAGKLVSDGIIDWGTRFFDLFPELSEGSRKEYRDITLLDLLSHRAGIRPYLSSGELEALPELTGDIMEKRRQFAGYVLKEKPVKTSQQSLFKKYAYSNAGYILAAAMLEKAGGASWEMLVDRIFTGDLGFAAHVGFPVDLGPDQPRGHLPGAYLGESKDVLMVYDTEYILKNDDVLGPAGNISMPMSGYAEFIRLHLQGLRGGDNYLSADMYRFMHFGVAQYAVGWENSRKNKMDVSSHSGSKGNFFCHVRIIPDKDLAVIVFANSGILNALDPLKYFFGGLKLEKYLDDIEKLYESS